MRVHLLLGAMALICVPSAQAQPSPTVVSEAENGENEPEEASLTQPSASDVVPEVRMLVPAPETEPLELEVGPESECTAEVAASDHPSPVGRAIASLDSTACHALLQARNVSFEILDLEGAEGVGIPIRLRGPLDGVRVTHRGASELHEIVDCRLAVALLEWAPTLREAGITALQHYSIYRPGARVARSGRVSGHAHALAIDLGRVQSDAGDLVVLEGWEARERGVDPCAGPFEESEASARLRQVVCDAVARDLFQVVITPHHDHAHRNHVHLEVRPGVSWSYVH